MNTETTIEAEISTAAAQVAALESERPELDAVLEKAKRDEEAAPNLTAKLKAHGTLAAIQSALETHSRRFQEATERLTGLKARRERERREEAIRTAHRVWNEALKRCDEIRAELEALIRERSTLLRDYAGAMSNAHTNARRHASVLCGVPEWEKGGGKLRDEVLFELGFGKATIEPGTLSSFDSCITILRYAKSSGAYPADLPALEPNEVAQ